MTCKVVRGVDPLMGKEADLSIRAIVGRREDLAPVFHLRPEQLRDVTAVVYHAWEISRHRIAKPVPGENMLITTGGAAWAFGNWESRQRYHLENFREALDVPGEWFLDRNGTLYYITVKDEEMTKADVVAPVVEQFVRFKGSPWQVRRAYNTQRPPVSARSICSAGSGL